MEGHPFTTVKHGIRPPAVSTVELRGVNFKCQINGKVFAYDPAKKSFTNEIYFMSPLAAEVRKASGWFE